MPDVKPSCDECTAGDHFHRNHTDLFLLHQAKEPVQVLWVLHFRPCSIENNQRAVVGIVFEGIRKQFHEAQGEGGKRVSLADLVVLGGAAAIEDAAKRGGHDVQVPFAAGRTDASQEMTDVASFEVLEPRADGFRNYYGAGNYRSPTDMLVDRADLLTLTVPEMTALVGGMRALGANAGGSKHGVFTGKPGTLGNDFFVNLLDMSTRWEKSKTDGVYNGLDRKTGQVKWTATPVDLIFGSQSELRAVAEVYASENDKFVKDFVAAWSKVMTLDRFEL